MEIRDKVVVVTGGANGIGRALCRRFAADGARGVVVSDRDAEGSRRVAEEIGGRHFHCDVTSERQVNDLVAFAIKEYGPIDLFCSNAGIVMMGGIEVADEEWEKILSVNFRSHLYAARAVIPGMLERGQGYLLQTASAAGLLTQLASAPYSVTKHAAVAFAEWLSITYGDQGIKVSCLCPMGVNTDMVHGENPFSEFLRDTAVEPEDLAECVVRGIANEQFLILPHPEVGTYFRRKADDYDRWMKGMRRLQRVLEEKWRENH